MLPICEMGVVISPSQIYLNDELKLHMQDNWEGAWEIIVHST